MRLLMCATYKQGLLFEKQTNKQPDKFTASKNCKMLEKYTKWSSNEF